MEPATHDPQLISNTEFLEELAQAVPDGSCMWVNRFGWNPDEQRPGQWAGLPYLPKDHERRMCDAWADDNTYFSVAALKSVGGRIARQKVNFTRMLALVVDDVDIESLYSPPSWVLETSPGKAQAGFFLDPDDSDCSNEELCTAVVKSMTMKGFIKGDVSGNNSVRYVRLPVGTNLKPRATGHHRHKLTTWNPRIRLSLDDACGAVGMDLDAVRKAMVTSSPTGTALGPSVPQEDKLQQATRLVMEGHFHEPLNIISASMIASGAHPAAVTNMLRGLMDAYPGPHDERWLSRYNDIPRCVKGAEEKFARREPPPELVIDPETGEISPSVPQGLSKLVRIKDLILNRKPPQWLIKGLLVQDHISVLYGQSYTGKSYIAVDMACHIAMGKRWRGKPTQQGGVIYVAGEGNSGLTDRVIAWGKKHGFSSEQMAEAPIAISHSSVMVDDPGALQELEADIDQLVAEYGKPAMIVVDTLARNFQGDENAAKDIGAFINGLDRLRTRYGAHIMFVHHTGKNGELRGSSALLGNPDARFKLSFDGSDLLLVNEKLKDSREHPPIAYRIESMELGEDEDGELVLAGVACEGLTLLDEVVIEARQVKGKEREQVTIGDILLPVMDAPGHALSRVAIEAALMSNKQGVTGKPVRNAVDALIDRGLLVKSGESHVAKLTLSDDAVGLFQTVKLIGVTSKGKTIDV